MSRTLFWCFFVTIMCRDILKFSCGLKTPKVKFCNVMSVDTIALYRPSLLSFKDSTRKTSNIEQNSSNQNQPPFFLERSLDQSEKVEFQKMIYSCKSVNFVSISTIKYALNV